MAISLLRAMENTCMIVCWIAGVVGDRIHHLASLESCAQTYYASARTRCLGPPTDPVPGAYYGHNFGQRLAGTVLDGALCSPWVWLSFANNLPFGVSLVGVICLGPCLVPETPTHPVPGESMACFSVPLRTQDVKVGAF